MTDWFRSWHGAPTDPKWLGIARRANVAPGIAVAVGWALMDRASQASERGCIEGYDADGLACFFGCEPEQVDAIVSAMTDKGMIAEGRLTNWEKRQPKREDGAAERAREWRERNRTQPNAPDKDSDTEKKEAPPAPAAKDELARVLDGEHVEAVIEHRKKKRAPLTAHAAKLLAAKFARWPNPNEAADAMIANGWQGFEVEWMQNRKTNGHDPPPTITSSPPPGFREAKSTAEYIAYMQNKTGDPKLTVGDWRLSKWQHVPVDFTPLRKASA